MDEKKKRKAQRILRRVAERAQESPKPLTDWEKEFVQGVGERLDTYGSAFRDPGKGRLEDALSVRQTHIMRQLDKKTRKAVAEDPAKPGGSPPPADDRPKRSSFKRKSPMRPNKSIRSRTDEAPEALEPEPPPRPSGPPVLRVVRGGKS